MVELFYISGMVMSLCTLFITGALVMALFSPSKPVAGTDRRTRWRKFLDKLDEL